MRFILIIIAGLFTTSASAQFHGIVGSANCNALHTDSSVFVAWGAQCKVTRGFQDISNTSLGYASVGDSSYVIGKADAGVVSLGDGGKATVTFSVPVTDATGYDFAVFENSFNDSFLELAFVEVSSDGINFVRFPSTCNLPENPQYDNNANMDASKINNLAGKHRALYGTPFDLQELNGNPLVDITSITHIRIIDVIGNINQPFANFDSQNHVINEPWPTPFPSSGFDLDAIGVIHQKAVGINEINSESIFSIYPNPSSDYITIRSTELITYNQLSIFNLVGIQLMQIDIISNQQIIDVSKLESGIYIVQISSEKGNHTKKIIIE